jgi:predicted signal transduction protein with EAL and GGDEF domain
LPSLPDQLIKQAGIALFQAKQQGRGRCCFFAPAMMVKLREDQVLMTDLRAAVVNQTLVLHYQPQVDLRSGGVVGAEALLRWHRPGFGMVPPDRFIELAEDIGMIVCRDVRPSRSSARVRVSRGARLPVRPAGNRRSVGGAAERRPDGSVKLIVR